MIKLCITVHRSAEVAWRGTLAQLQWPKLALSVPVATPLTSASFYFCQIDLISKFFAPCNCISSASPMPHALCGSAHLPCTRARYSIVVMLYCSNNKSCLPGTICAPLSNKLITCMPNKQPSVIVPCVWRLPHMKDH